jgi:hypothetical protein
MQSRGAMALHHESMAFAVFDFWRRLRRFLEPTFALVFL